MAGIITVPLHIGDFLSGTLHMDTLEKGAYVMLLLSHYQAGANGLPNNDLKLSRIAGVSPTVWKRIKPIILEKFEIVGEFLQSAKVKKVICGIEEKSSAQRAKVLKRHNSGHTVVIPDNYQPKPKPNILSKEESIARRVERPDGVSANVWCDFLRQRKSKLTQTALDGIQREVAKAGITLEAGLRVAIERGWQSFKADWIRNKNETNRTNFNGSNGKSRRSREVIAEAFFESHGSGNIENIGSSRFSSD